MSLDLSKETLTALLEIALSKGGDFADVPEVGLGLIELAACGGHQYLRSRHD